MTTPSSFPSWVKPMTIGGIIDQSFKVYRTHFSVFFLTALITLAPTLITQIFSTKSTNPSMGLLMMAMPLTVLSVIFRIWALGAIIYLGSEAFLGKSVNFKEASAKGRKIFFPLIRAMFSYSIRLVLPIVILFAVLGGFMATQFRSHNFLLISIALAGGVVALVWWVNFAVSYSLYNQAVVLEGMVGAASLKRSYVLIRERTEKGFFKNNVWRLSVIYIVLLVIWAPIMSIPFIPMIMMKFGSLGMTTLPMGAAILAILQSFASAFLFPISLITLTLFYYDIRIRKEGLDMALRASAISSSDPNPQ